MAYGFHLAGSTETVWLNPAPSCHRLLFVLVCMFPVSSLLGPTLSLRGGTTLRYFRRLSPPTTVVVGRMSLL